MAHHGTIDLGNGYVFHYVNDKEVYGLVEKDDEVVSGTAGFYRTSDPEVAARATGFRR